jgi:hypothetical protein
LDEKVAFISKIGEAVSARLRSYTKTKYGVISDKKGVFFFNSIKSYNDQIKLKTVKFHAFEQKTQVHRLATRSPTLGRLN